MDVLYIPQLDETGSGGEGEGGGVAARYRILRRVPEDGVVNLSDRAITRIDVANGCDALRLVVPPEAKGSARDFLVRLVVTADEIPEVTFAAPSGETISFEEESTETFRCVVGVNVFAFTETDQGAFVVHRKAVSLAQQVSFDANGGTVETPARDYLLGARYEELPTPTRTGYSFLGWTTEDGVEVKPTDTVKTSVARLVAQWEVYVDKFAPAIGQGGGLVFVSDGDSKWTLDADEERGDVARSGAIGDGQKTSLYTEFEGAGTISFCWKISSESGYDRGVFLVDGVQKVTISGEQPWRTYAVVVSGEGRHTAEWRYQKDESVSRGSDCVWLDDVAWEAS
jgi:uncharacterized repeat protein (TIGR02543 family)